MKLVLSLLVVLSICGSTVGASIAFRTAPEAKSNSYIDNGVISGGTAGPGTTLLKVRKSYSAKSQIERVIVDLGDKDAKPTGKKIGYFQAALDRGNHRLVLDLTQLKLSKVNEAQVRALFKKDSFVASAGLDLDAEEQAGRLILNFKRPVRIDVFQLLKEQTPGRVVIDIAPGK